MLRVALLCSLAALAAAGCGGKSGAAGTASHTVIETSKAFSDAGIPFDAAVTSNPYVKGQQVYLPGKLNGGELQQHVLSMLSGSTLSAHAGWVVWVFDTDAGAQKAVQALPLAKWGAGERKITRAIDGNVIVVASNFGGAQKPKLDAALANLRS